ncbi:MAG: formate dehydrogenase, partial [Steroidobacteraceae bacterium]|nr:formate dehydrogenase [Steroidobacteraceae bacterium]
VDAFDSEMVRFADLVLPDTTFLERFDAISLLDRPISEPDAAADAIRHPILQPDRDVRPWQDVLIDLAGRLQLPAFVDANGAPKYRNYQDFIVHYERSPGIGFLAGWRGRAGERSLVGEPNSAQWQAYIEQQGFFEHRWRPDQQFHRHINRDYQQAAVAAGFIDAIGPLTMQLYSEPLQKFRLAGLGRYPGPQPPRADDRARLARYCDPLPFWYAPLNEELTDSVRYPLHAVTQRPMVLYHSWDGQNAWLRQIVARNYLYINAATAAELGLSDYDWVWLESDHGKIRCQIKTQLGCERHTVWTWNAVAKMPGTFGLDVDAPEATAAFLLNDLISQSLPGGAARYGNADPITGQAAWYDLRVRITRAEPGAVPPDRSSEVAT